jgi:hypothetical protein
MRSFLCAVLVLIASAGICVRAESDEAMKIARADPNAPAATPGPAQSGAPEQKLVGLAAWNKLVGNSISGTEDGQPLTEYYAPDGTAKSMLGSEISTGTWMLVGEVICFKYPDDDKPECYRSKSPATRQPCMTKMDRERAIKF